MAEGPEHVNSPTCPPHAIGMQRARARRQAHGSQGTVPGRVAVTVAFDQPVDDAEYPLDVCAIDAGGQPITGARWLLGGDDIVAVSPRWGADLICEN